MRHGLARDERGLPRSRREAPLPVLGPTRLVICGHPQCRRGAPELRAALAREAEARELELTLGEAPTVCRGDCAGGPYLGLGELGLFYGGVAPEEAAELVTETCLAGRLLFPRLLVSPLTVTDSRVHYPRSRDALVLLEEDRCPLQAAAYIFRFNAAESCGKCLPCRLGVHRVETLLRQLENGGAGAKALQELEQLTQAMARDSYCDFAAKVTAPLRLVLELAREEVVRHLEGGCPHAAAGLEPLGRGGA